MATIQVRDVPEECYEVLRRRARRAGQSIQLYMRDQLIALAVRPTKEESVAAIESVLGRVHDGESGLVVPWRDADTGGGALSAASVVDDLAAERR